MAKTFYWEIKKDAKVAFLIGSIHALRGDFRIHKNLIKAFNSAEVLIVECNIPKYSKEDISKEYLKYFLEDNKTLEDYVDSKSLKKISKEFSNNNLDFNLFKKFQPWVINNFLFQFILQKENAISENGIDNIFYKLANKNKKEILELETFSEQLEFMSKSDFDYELNNLKEWSRKKKIQELVENFFKMEHSYLKGDLKEFKNLLEDENENTKNKRIRLLRERKLKKRILKMLEDYDSSFIVIGLSHILRDPSLVDFLKNKGFNVELKSF